MEGGGRGPGHEAHTCSSAGFPALSDGRFITHPHTVLPAEFRESALGTLAPASAEIHP